MFTFQKSFAGAWMLPSGVEQPGFGRHLNALSPFTSLRRLAEEHGQSPDALKCGAEANLADLTALGSLEHQFQPQASLGKLEFLTLRRASLRCCWSQSRISQLEPQRPSVNELG